MHLAFKDAVVSDEVYDTLVSIFLHVASRYDPHYTQKTKEICNRFASAAPNATLSLSELGNGLAYNPAGCIRVLKRHHYLQAVRGSKNKVEGYQRGPGWPAPESFFRAGPIGFTYFLQRWFRYGLQDYIKDQMGRLENQEHVLQLDCIKPAHHEDEDGYVCGLPHAEGNWIDSNGIRWAADVSMLELWRQLDISPITEEWVKQTDDYLFRNLDSWERWLLQMVFVKEYSWKEIAGCLDSSAETAKRHFNQIMQYLVDRAKS